MEAERKREVIARMLPKIPKPVFYWPLAVKNGEK
jgi:hypothetical protein